MAKLGKIDKLIRFRVFLSERRKLIVDAINTYMEGCGSRFLS